jgi:hypothetical protein
LPHYNGGGFGLGKYYVNQAMEPEYTSPGTPSEIIFSIQDNQGNDVYNIRTMVEIYSGSTGERLKVYPWTQQNIGDFQVGYTFSKVGSYQIVLSIANENANNNQINNGVDPPRGVLGSAFNCNCERAVFTVSVSKNFGDIFLTAVLVGIFGMMTVFGLVLWYTYKSKRKNHVDLSNNKQLTRYFIMLLAISAGVIHLAVFSEHGSLRIEYSIFLLAAGSSQVAYSILYLLLTLSDESGLSNKELAKLHYRKTLVVNLFGLIGTLILLALYLYAVILPPPLSPSNKPEEVDLGGVLDKAIEIGLTVGIIYLMIWEKRKFQTQLITIK